MHTIKEIQMIIFNSLAVLVLDIPMFLKVLLSKKNGETIFWKKEDQLNSKYAGANAFLTQYF